MSHFLTDLGWRQVLLDLQAFFPVLWLNELTGLGDWLGLFTPLGSGFLPPLGMFEGFLSHVVILISPPGHSPWAATVFGSVYWLFGYCFRYCIAAVRPCVLELKSDVGLLILALILAVWLLFGT